MFKRSKVSLAVALSLSGAVTLPAIAQDAAQRVEITGSSIRRINSEAALPVQVITKDDVLRSGATSTVDLLSKLPSIQGSTRESASVGGLTFGFSGVSVHNIGEQRTLVLLNGHRVAIFGGQQVTGFAAGFDLNSLPISAIQRVEVLSDGASALYGSDAIAGVVNFITKRDSTDGDLTLGLSTPKGGAKEKRFSLTKGFGTQGANGFNAFMTFAHDERTQLNSTQRDFAKTGQVFFTDNGKRYRFQQLSASPIPANALTDLTDTGVLISPTLKTTGKCPDKSFEVNDGQGNDYCGFNFVGELEIYPIRKRDSGMVSLTKVIGAHELFADLLLSQTQQTSRIAPVPGSISIPAGSPLAIKYLVPVGITADTIATYRLYDLGKRTSSDVARFMDLALGSRGAFGGWDYNAAYTHSESEAKEDVSGYPGTLAAKRLRASGLLDPFVGIGQQSAAAQAAINAANYNGYWDGGKSKLDTLGVRGSRELMQMGGGAMSLGTGINFNKENFESKPSLFAQGLLSDPVAGTLCDLTKPKTCDQRFGDSSKNIPYSASRQSYGVFGELAMPFAKTLEANLAVRFDHYSDFGSATTGKASFKWTPVSNMLIRGSLGTGFHAPSVPQVNAFAQPFGVTSDKYACTPALLAIATSLGGICRPGSAQYDVLSGGNKKLQPEKSNQGTLGIRFDPIRELSLGVDYWAVNIKNQFGQVAEQAVFKNPAAFPNSFRTNVDVGTGANYLAWLNQNLNLGEYKASGLDFDFTAKVKTGAGDWNSQFTMTYMLKEDQQIDKNGPFFSAISNYNDSLGVVTFRYQGRWANSLKTGALTNTLAVNFKSGYDDQRQDATTKSSIDLVELDAAGNAVGPGNVRLHIKNYYTLDYQGAWDISKSMTLTFGLLNLTDEKPPFSIATSGTNKGQQFGFDDRYYDPRGRTYYANFSFRF